MLLEGLRDCKDCSLCEGRKKVVPGKGPPDAELVFVGIGPGKEEDETGRPFVGEAGKILNRAIKRAGFDLQDIKERMYITNVVKCIPPNNKPTKKQTKACAHYLDEELEIIAPKIIMPLGAIALERVTGMTGIMLSRGKPIVSEKYGAVVVPSVHPAYIYRNPSELQKLIDDIVVAKKILDAGEYVEPEKIPLDHRIASKMQHVQWLFKKLKEAKIVAIDIETTNANIEEGKIISVHFSWREGVAVALPLLSNGGADPYWEDDELEEVWKLLREFLESPTPKVFQNGKFDCKFFHREGVWTENVKYDTMLMHYLLYPEGKGTHGLKYMSRRYTDIGEYDVDLQTIIKKHGSLEGQITDEELLPYGNKDADATFRIAKILWREMKKIDKEDAKRGLGTNLCWVLQNILLPLQEVLMLTEYRGVLIDLEYSEKMTEEYEKQINALSLAILKTKAVQEFEEARKKAIMRERRAKWRNSKSLQSKHEEKDYVEVVKQSQYRFKPSSSKQLVKLLFERLDLPVVSLTKTRQPCTDKDAVQELLDKHVEKGSDAYEILNTLAELKTVSKFHSTYFRPLPKLVDSNRRLHTSYWIHGAGTGRLSSREPNLQNIPKTAHEERAKEVRRSYISAPGYKFVEADFKQIEFRWWAEYSQDKALLRDIKAGMDIHDSMAREVFEIPDDKEVSGKQRMLAKTVVFGSIYGRSVKSIADQFGIPEKEAQVIQDTFLGRYPQAGSKWIRDQQAFVRKWEKSVSFFGRHRDLPAIHSPDGGARGHAYRQAVNTPIQSAAADTAFLLGFIATQRMLKEKKFDAHILLNIHDSVILEVREDQLDEVVTCLVDVMETPVEGPNRVSSVPMKIDIAIGDNLADMEEIEL